MRRWGIVAATVAVGLLASCTSGSKPGEAGSGSKRPGPGKASTTHAKAETPVAQAKRLAAQYDYDGAEKAIVTDTSGAASSTRAQIKQARSGARAFADPTQVSHLFYHSLIVDPARAFAANQSQRAGYAQFMVTQREFEAQLKQLHRRGYVLVHAQRLVAKDAGGTMRPQQLMLPPGKKPFVLSIDDVSYYEYMDGAGFAKNLVIKDGKVTNTYVDAAGRTHHGAYDVSTVVDDFVGKHPDFSYRGDKGTIALTGYNGILGYRTSVKEYGDTPRTRAEQQQAKTVADALKKGGWKFASHSWGHINMTTAPLKRVKADAALWDNEVKPLTGPTDQLIYAFGADISGMPEYSSSNAKFDFLHRTEGFDYFFPIDTSVPAWSQVTPTSFRQARINIDGITMQRELDGAKTPLRDFFDTRSTVDPARPLPVPK